MRRRPSPSRTTRCCQNCRLWAVAKGVMLQARPSEWARSASSFASMLASLHDHVCAWMRDFACHSCIPCSRNTHRSRAVGINNEGPRWKVIGAGNEPIIGRFELGAPLTHAILQFNHATPPVSTRSALAFKQTSGLSDSRVCVCVCACVDHVCVCVC